MKKYFKKGWQKVFLVIGIALIAVDLYFIVTSPTVIPQQYLEYGPSIEGDVFDKVGDVSDKVETEIENNTNDNNSGESNSAGIPPHIMKSIVALTVGIVGILIVSTIIDGRSSEKKKK